MKQIELPVYHSGEKFEVEKYLGRVNLGCDLNVCKGACCTMPGAAGAPILESEIAELERVLPFVEKYLSEEAIEVIARNGIYERQRDGSLTIHAVAERDCVFVTYDGDVALCGIEKAYRAGEITGFQKPISCHLFPIRIYPTSTPGTLLICYEEIHECEGGRKRGKKEEINLLDFLETPLVRALGHERVGMLRKALE